MKKRKPRVLWVLMPKNGNMDYPEFDCYRDEKEASHMSSCITTTKVVKFIEADRKKG